METHNAREDNRFLRFDKITLDFGTYAVFREGRPVHLPEDYWKALALLVERRPYVVQKEELFKILGSSTDGTLTKQIQRIREFLGDTTKRRRFIKSERKIGYKWIADPKIDDQAQVEAPRGEISDATEQLELLTAEYLASVPKAQKPIWGPHYGLAVGLYIDTLLGKFIPWTELKSEIEKRLLSQVGLHVPPKCTVLLSEEDDNCGILGGACVRIIDPKGKSIGYISFTGDPDSDWNSYVLVRLGHHTYDDYVVDYKFQRYSDGTYRRLEIEVRDMTGS